MSRAAKQSRVVKRLEDMTLQQLWELFPITLVPHDDRWTQWAAEEIECLKSNVLDLPNVEIHHIGSTAIKGIWAKPIVDLLVESDFCRFGEIKHKLLLSGGDV